MTHAYPAQQALEAHVVEQQLERRQTKGMAIVVWCCPTADCDNYFGHSSMPDLAQQENKRSSMRNQWDENPSQWGQSVGTRATCPDCGTQRVAIWTQVTVPVVAP